MNISFEVIVERASGTSTPVMDKRKFLIPNDITVAQFTWIIRARLQLAPEVAMFLILNKTIPLLR